MGQCRQLSATVSVFLIAVVSSAEGVGDASLREKARRALQPFVCEQRPEAQLLRAPMTMPPRGSASGSVDLDATIGPDGKVHRVVVTQTAADAKLVAAARENAMARLYCPAYKNGIPVETHVPIRFQFREPTAAHR
jgi:outer membrane biosynthesis protein TonB